MVVVAVVVAAAAAAVVVVVVDVAVVAAGADGGVDVDVDGSSRCCPQSILWGLAAQRTLSICPSADMETLAKAE